MGVITRFPSPPSNTYERISKEIHFPLGAYEFGVPDPLAGENIKAYKYPRSLEFQREILKGAAGKILPRVLREEEMKKRR